MHGEILNLLSTLDRINIRVLELHGTVVDEEHHILTFSPV